MKSISVVVPTYNEQDNIGDVYTRLKAVFAGELSGYRCEIIFIDNCSKDDSRRLIEELCEKDKTVKAVFNAKNFGYSKSIFYGLMQSESDCAILMNADLQDPPEVIPRFVAKWEEGYRIVAGIKTESDESRLMYFLRSVYYSIIKRVGEVEHISHFDGFGLYDRRFIEVMRELKDPLPYLRGIVSEIGYRHATVDYRQVKRRKGHTAFNFFKLYDLAMLGVTSYTKAFMRLAVFIGIIISVLSILGAILTVILRLIYPENYPLGTATIIVGIFFLGGLQLMFIGLLGEYILNINYRVMNRPLVVEEKRINFD